MLFPTDANFSGMSGVNPANKERSNSNFKGSVDIFPGLIHEWAQNLMIHHNSKHKEQSRAH